MYEFAGRQATARSRVDAFGPLASPPAGNPALRADNQNFLEVTTWHSGLPLTMRRGRPVAPKTTFPRRLQLALKRVLHIVGALSVLLILGPSLLLLALAIRFSSPGPALFRQTREGLGGAPIRIYKFRTLYSERCDVSGIAQVERNDPRVTPLGRVLRRTSIDELPQLINVLKGEMSLIGPRPHVFGTLAAGLPYDRLVPYYAARRTMRPGLSGWAQANGYRGPTDEAERARARIDHDLAYIENYSLLLDIRIVWMTLRHEFLGGTGL